MVQARAGGGQNYAPAERRSPPKSSGSSYSKSPSYYPSQNINNYSGNRSSGNFGTAIFVIVILVIIVMIILKRLQEKGLVDESRGENNLIDGASFPSLDPLHQLKVTDPHFDIGEFKSRVTKAFLDIQMQWSRGTMESARPFLTDGVFERLTLNLEQLRDEGLSNRLDSPIVLAMTPFSYTEVGKYGIINLKISASGKDVTVDTSGKIIESSSSHFTEIWTFIRRLSAKTAVGKLGLIEKSCPSCGAFIEVSNCVRCKNCQCIIKSGEHDWVLNEITQASEAGADRNQDVLQMARSNGVLQQDEDFCGQILEDTATVMFVRYLRARNSRNPIFIQKCSSSDFFNAFSKSIVNESIVDKKVAIGSASVVGFSIDEATDRVLSKVEFKWSSQRSFEIEAVHRTGTLTLARHRFAKSVNGLGVVNCKACGAPDDGKASNQCSYCGQVFNNESLDWVLVNVDLT